MSGDFLVRNLLVKHYITIVLIIVYGIKLNARKNAKDVELRFFWITLICCFLLVIEDVAESMAALDPGHRKGITAVASLDMNGLKQINDTQGHEAGDVAIAEVGRCLRRANRHDTTAYRIGGDEFVIVFVQQSEVIVAQTLEKLKRSVIRSGYSISAGYAMTKDSESVEAALRESDQNMYKEKAAYYQQKGVDRRKRI